MNTLLVAVNSKYIHTSLSVRTLSSNTNWTPFVEYTINEEISKILTDLYEKNADVLCFSCYIWNIEFITKLCKALKKVLPNTLFVFGGPEVSHSAEEFLKENSFPDAVIFGEGEETLKELISKDFSFKGVTGVVYKENNSIVNNGARQLISNLDTLVFPYTDTDLEKNSGKLIYYESSRGCPYNCSYCLSSTEHGVRFKSVDKVKTELEKVIKFAPKTVKFTDRTFNSDIKRSMELIKFMIEKGEGVTFHFEISAHTLNDEFISLVSKAPKGMFRFEIGLQSTNPKTISAIHRSTDFNKLAEITRKLSEAENVHIHLDLIAGLPYEDIKSFEKSFNDAVALKPTVLQLGFLKLLKGTYIRNYEKEHGYVFLDYPPYEILENKYLSYKDITLLKKIEEVFEKYYNSEAFKNSMAYLISNTNNPFNFFREFALWFEEKGYFNIQIARKTLYEILSSFAEQKSFKPLFFDILKLDYFTSNTNASTPSWSKESYDLEVHKNRIEIIENNLETVFLRYKELNIREILKLVHFESFDFLVHEDNKKSPCILAFSKNGEYIGEIKK